MITDIQYEITSFFNQLDQKLAGDPFIQKYGPADIFRDMVENLAEEVNDNELRRARQELEAVEENLDDLKREIRDAISELENYLNEVTEDVDVDKVEKAIRDLKWAI